MQDLKPIRVFLEVAERQSFAAAARALRLTPATVTRIVARLEKDLGQQLLVRTTRQVALTTAGALVAARYRPLIDEFDRVKAELDRETQPHRGRLSINAPMSFGMRLLPQLAASFRLAYPNITLNIRLTDRLVDIVDEECDLAIRIAAPPTDRSTIWRKICEIPRDAIASAALFDRVPRPAHPSDLDPSLCLSYGSQNTPETWVFRQGATQHSVTAGTDIISNNGDFLYEMVRAEAGIAVLPRFIHDAGVKEGHIERLVPDWHASSLWLSLFYPPYEKLPPLVATFTEFFEAYLADLDGFNFTP